ncbi:MAG TPA: adenylate/guanylate cyclase domain-containing protein [Syntrophales bacterium]|nr:adenylate/guanylate cyclase domain-containing protein [Syntrophales bacterium]
MTTGILIIDDEEGVRRSLRKVLEREGYSVYQAENGLSGLDVLKENCDEIEIAVSDFRMPGIDGLETLVEIEKINPEITRIILTGYATMESAIESVNAGIDGFLTKPFDNSELRSRIRECAVRKRLKPFVSEQVLSALQGEKTALSPMKRKATVLFSDIRGFSRLAEKMGPAEISELLNACYFWPLDNIIFEFDGTLDKHIGDGIMGIFGAPFSSSDDAMRAVLSALAMRERMEEVNRKLSGRGINLSIGIGIGTGEVMAGVFGSNRKKEYTVFGSVVNLASRLESIAGEGEILICEDTRREIDGIEVEKLEGISLPGISRRGDVYRVIGKTK